MNYIIKTKKLGENWFLDITHVDPRDIMFNEKIGKVFSMLDKNKIGELKIVLTETYSFVENNTMFLSDEDLLKYFVTDDTFDMRFTINDHEFSISTDMYSLIEYVYNPNFHKNSYILEQI